MRSINRLSALAVKNASQGKHYDGGGLFLRVDKNGTGRWVYRFRLHGRQREMGMGSRDDLKLTEIRRERDRWRAVVALGHDPIRQREAEARERSTERPTFETVTLACFEARKSTLKSDGKAGRWLSPVSLHVFPHIGKMPIEDVTQNDIRDALSSIWKEKADTARKAMNRVGLVMTHGAAMGLNVDLQATLKAKALLGEQDHVVKHIEAMPWGEVPEFACSLAGQGIVSECLLFAILTLARSGSVRAARWEDIDLAARVWTVPSEYMKGKKGKTNAFRIPLSNAAVDLLRRVEPFERDGLVFPSSRKGCISDMATGKLMRCRGLEYRPHGFRSSFRDWCEHVGIDYIVAEMCLAHTVGGKVERAYRRDDLLEKRAVAIQRWSDHCSGNGSAKLLNIAG